MKIKRRNILQTAMVIASVGVASLAGALVPSAFAQETILSETTNLENEYWGNGIRAERPPLRRWVTSTSR
jgi:hypothetical protein